jgi:hypothetical protein
VASSPFAAVAHLINHRAEVGVVGTRVATVGCQPLPSQEPCPRSLIQCPAG